MEIATSNLVDRFTVASTNPRTIDNHTERDVVRSHDPFNFYGPNHQSYLWNGQSYSRQNWCI